MRTKTTYYDGDIHQSWSEFYTHYQYGTVTQRIDWRWIPTSYNPYVPGHWESYKVPVGFQHVVSPFRTKTWEAASDLPERNTRRHWNQFQHYRRDSGRVDYPYRTGSSARLADRSYYDSVDLFTPDELYDGTACPFGSSDNPTVGLPLLYQPTATGFIPDPPGLTELCQRGLRAMLPGIRPQLSLVNSVIELKDFRWLRDIGRRILTRDGQLRQLKRFIRYFRRFKTLRQILGGGSDGYLQYKFNVLPLLSDICGFRRGLETARHEVNKLLANEAKLVRRHFVCPLGAPYNILPVTREYYPTPGTSLKVQFLDSDGNAGEPQPGYIIGGVDVYRSVESIQGTFHMEIEYSYFLSSYERENALLLGFLDSLGVNLNPSIIWNAIPWSFVIDWVFGVSRWLDQFKERNLDPLTIIHRCLWSTEITRTVGIDIKPNIGVVGLPQGEARAVTCTETAYKRQLYGVTTNDLLTSGVSLSEFSLASALYLSKVGRR